jgi:RIO kinase 1
VRGNKLDKTTSEQVMDQRTRVLLLKLLNTQLLSEINGVVSTGKEANVYHAIGGSTEPAQLGTEYAIKIFKTTLNEFKNRADYVEGEFRFRRQSLHNPRKLIKLWAEKEMRNLKRLQTGGINSPIPIVLKENVLVMTFVGKDGTPAPRLKDIKLSADKQRACYLQVIKAMRKMYQACRLVHGDLSEYNLLYMKGQIWIIDVSQAVEHTHPKALEFLRRDCECICTFFQGVQNAMNTRDLFEFVVDINLAEGDEDKYITKLEEVIATRDPEEANKQDFVFRNSFIARTLHQVKKPADEIFGEEEDVFHQAVNGLKQNILDDDEDDSEGYSDEEEELLEEEGVEQ